jgi:hypothetical protein
MKLPPKDGFESTFADDLDALAGFGKKNKESLGELLFQFFRFYGHEFDYDKFVISVRNGRQITKVDKGWHITNNNQLCVEEPFNTNRNLGNTADDTSFRGLHIEIRRAFDLLCEAKLEQSCEEFKFPKETEKVWERPPQKPKPILRSTSQSSNRGRGGTHRGGRHNNQHSRNGNNNRRASSGAFDAPPQYIPGVPINMSTQDAWLQHQAQARLHNELYTTYSVLQAQENSLRLQLYAQGFQNQAYAQSQAQAQAQAQSNGGTIKSQQATDRNRTSSFDQPPLTAPIRPEMYFYPLQYQAAPMYGYQTPSTNPSSPSLSSAVPELRRSMHRSTVTNGSGPAGQPNSSMRSHSQPATRSGSSPLAMQGGQMAHPGLGIYQNIRQANGISIPNFIADENLDTGYEPSISSAVTPPEDNTPKEYVGYYVSDHTQSPMRKQSAAMAVPAFGDAIRPPRRLSTDQLPQSILDRLKRSSRSPSPLGHDRSYSTGTHSAPLTAVPSQQGIFHQNLRALNHHGPMVVNGSSPVPVSIPNWQASVVSEGSIPEDRGSDTLCGSLDSISQASVTGSDGSVEQDFSGQITPRETRPDGRMDQPMVVNGSSPLKSENGSVVPNLNGTVPRPIAVPNGSLPSEQNTIPPRLSPNTRNRLARQNGGMSPLDIGTGHNDILREDLPHLSPVYETRTPSPTATRKFESLERRVNGLPFRGAESKLASLDTTPKPITTNGTQAMQGSPVSKSNGHTRASKSEGAAGAWQKIQKSKRKGPVDMKNGDSPVQNERIPAQENERKGG